MMTPETQERTRTVALTMFHDGSETPLSSTPTMAAAATVPNPNSSADALNATTLMRMLVA